MRVYTNDVVRREATFSGTTGRPVPRLTFAVRNPLQGVRKVCANTSLDDGVCDRPPLLLRVVHHNIDEDREKPAYHRGSVADLVSINAAVPSGATMD